MYYIGQPGCIITNQSAIASKTDITLVWAPGHNNIDIEGNEIADSLTKRGAEILFSSAACITIETIKWEEK